MQAYSNAQYVAKVTQLEAELGRELNCCERAGCRGPIYLRSWWVDGIYSPPARKGNPRGPEHDPERTGKFRNVESESVTDYGSLYNQQEQMQAE